MTPTRQLQMQVWLQQHVGTIAVVVLLAGVALQASSWITEYQRIQEADRLLASAARAEIPKTDADKDGDGKANTPPQPPQQNKNVADVFKRQKFSYSVSAVFNNKALVNNQLVKAGDRIQMATVVAVDAVSVTIHEDGKPSPQTLYVFQGGAPSRPGGPGGRPPRGGRSGPRPPRQKKANGGLEKIPNNIRGMSVPRNAGLGRLDGKSFSQILGGLRDGTIGLDEIPAEHRERAQRMMNRQGRRGR